MKHDEPDEYANEDQAQAEPIDNETSSISGQSGTYELKRLSASQLDVGFPIAYSTQLVHVKSELEEEKEEKLIKDTWQKLADKPDWVRRSILHVKTSAARPLLPIPNRIRSILHELQLCWLAGQVGVLLWYAIKVDWQLRMHGPIQNLPFYVETQMPWLPGQFKRHFRLGIAIVCHALIYLPSAFGHFMYVLDDCPDETPLQLARKVVLGRNMRNTIRKTRRWSMDPRFDQFLRPKRRQWVTGILLLMSFGMLGYFLFLIFFELGMFAETKSWKNVVSTWIFEMQKNYYHQADQKLENVIQSEEIESKNSGNILDQLQIMFQCCGSSGAEGYQDWFHDDIRRPSRTEVESILESVGTSINLQDLEKIKWDIPLSCCQTGVIDCNPKNTDHLNKIGCAEPIFGELIDQWKSLGLKCLLLSAVLMIPQQILFLSIFQFSQAIKQIKTGCAEIYLKLTENKHVAKEAVERARSLSKRASVLYPRTSMMEQTAAVFEKLQKSKSQLFSKLSKQVSELSQRTVSA